MTLADISIKNPVFAWMLMAFLVVFGAVSFERMGVSQMPDVDFPNVTVNVTWEGASPEIMETDVIDVIEDAVMSVEGIEEVTASARHGSANITIEFDLDRDIDAAVQDVQTKLAQAMRLLPREIDPPIVTKTNPEDNPIMWIAISGHKPMQELVDIARDRVKDRFQTVPGVGEVMMGGYLDRNLRVWLKLEEMEARQLSIGDVMSALRQEHVEIPAGRIETDERELNVRAIGEAPTVAEFRNLVVAYRNDAPVLLEHIAIVEDGLADRRRLARVNGLPAIGMGIKKQRGANAVDVAHGVRERLKEIRAELQKEDVEIGVNFDSTEYIEESIAEIQFTLVLSVILTAVVCWLFLGSWSSTFNILLAIPTSIVGSFILMHFLGFTLNTFTLMSLSLAIGIVVDDAIMVLENIVRHREHGEARVKAASRGAREITFAAIAATFSIVAIFLPIAFMEGLIGKFLYQFGVTMSVAVAISLLEALTLTPMRCAQMLEVGERQSRLGRRLDRGFARLSAAYARTLAWSLRWRWAVLLGSVALFGGSLFVGRGLRQEMVPAQDQSRFLVRLQTPVGSSIDYTDARVRQAEAIIAERPEVSRYLTILGGFGGGEVDTGMMMITLKPPGERGPRPVTQRQVMDAVAGRFNAIPGIQRAIPIDLSQQGLGSRGQQFPIEFAVTGSDWTVLAEQAQRIMEKINDSGLMMHANSNYLVGMPEVKIIPDRSRAADLGVSMADIGNAVNALIGGVRAGKFTSGGHRFDVRVRLISEQRSRPEDIKRIFLRNRHGALVRLSDVVRTREMPTVQTITRRNRARAITVTANLAPGASQKDAMDRIVAMAGELPPGYGIDFTGASRMFQQGGSAFLFAIGMGVAIAYMILASQFNSYVHPILVLLAMPFSAAGAILAMLLADVSVNMYSMIGMVLLMGIVKKNSILLVDFTNQARARGRAVREALLEACPTRLRPILMTSFSTIAAAVPAALALGPGAETRIPMAVVVIGGVLLSTLLTLYVVPCAYLMLPGRAAREAVDAPEDPASRPSLAP